jgi:hypothetical protein
VSYGHASHLAQVAAGRALNDPATPPRPMKLAPIPDHLRPKATTR